MFSSLGKGLCKNRAAFASSRQCHSLHAPQLITTSRRSHVSFLSSVARHRCSPAIRAAAGAFVGGVLVAAGTTATVIMCDPKPNQSACPFDVEGLRKDIEEMLDEEMLAPAPQLVRLAWHEAGTFKSSRSAAGGCPFSAGGKKGDTDGQQMTNDGSANTASMRFAPEANHGANNGLGISRAKLEPLKQKYPGCSYADLWVLASLVAIEAMGGPKIPFRFGRKDAPSAEACAPDGRLPDASLGVQHIRDVFTRMGFSDREMVALIGAHAVGECYAENSGFVGPWTHDRYTFSNTFFTALMDEEWILDKRRPQLQYTDLATKTLMMLPTDVALLFDPSFKQLVAEYASSEDVFFRDFSKAYQRLVELGVEGQLRAV